MVLSYLITSGPFDKKHQSFGHPILAYFVMMSVLSATLVFFSEKSDYYPSEKQLVLFAWLIFYALILFSTRFVADSKNYLEQLSIYDMFWQCNVSLVLASIGSLIGKRDIVGACVASVALDQSLWWIDISWYFITGKFPIGVSKYITWPETTWVKVFTSTHHLWFIPVCIYFNEGLPWNSFFLSMILVAFMAIYSRLVIPFEIPYEGKMRYMNINCTHECWKDVKIQILHITDRILYIDKNFLYGFILLNCVWDIGNFIFFCLIKYSFTKNS
jgi:hypothetical protein